MATKSVVQKVRVVSFVRLTAMGLVSASLFLFAVFFASLSPQPSQPAPAPTAADLTSQLKQKITAFQKVSPLEKQAALADLQNTASQRKVAMQGLLTANDPDQFLNLSFSVADRKNIPSTLNQYIEQPVTTSGTLSIAIGDDVNQNLIRDISLATNNTTFTVYPSKLVVVPGASTVSATGYSLDTSLAVSSLTTQTTVTTSQSQQATAATVTKNVAIIYFNYADISVPGFNATTPAQVFFTNPNSVAAFHSENSFGRVALMGKNGVAGSVSDVYGPVNTSLVSTACAATSAWMTSMKNTVNAAMQARYGASWSSGYNTFVYVPPGGCPFLGLSDGAPGTFSLINGGPNFYSELVSHEVGHLLGANHAGYELCGDSEHHKVPFSWTCGAPGQYGDFYDVMAGAGFPQYQFNAFHKGESGLFVTGESTDVTAATTPTSITIHPIESTTGLKVVRVPWGTSGKYFYLEFRQPIGFFDGKLNPSATNGVLIHLAPDYNVHDWSDANNSGQIYVNDVSPVLTTGQTFTDPQKGVTIHTETVHIDAANPSNSYATVSISLTCGHASPALNISPIDDPHFGSPQPARYSVRVTNNDNPACGNSTLTVTPILPPGWTQTPSSLTFPNLPPYTTLTPMTATVTITPPAVGPDGNYTVKELAQNAGAPLYQSTQSSFYQLDTSPPVITFINPTDGSSVPSTGTVLIKTSASDLSAVVHTTIYIDPALNPAPVKDCGPGFAALCQYSWPMATVSSGSKHSIKVNSTDVYGHTTSSSISVCVGSCSEPITPDRIPD